MQTVSWLDKDTDLAEACSAEAHPFVLPSSSDALSWEPAPKTIRDISKMPEGPVQAGWLKSIKTELKTLFDACTFTLDTLKRR
jgi:hypothetical protein